MTTGGFRVRAPGLTGLLVALLSSAALAQPGPWARTETRQACASFDKYRQPFFGDTHVHTAYSSDALFAGTREDPRGAYRFAQGQAIGLPPFDAQGNPTRTAQLRRPLDFTAVTDHAEQFGEIAVCQTPGLAGYDSPECVSLRNQIAAPLPPLPSVLPPIPVIQFLLTYGVINPPTRYGWCGPGSDCAAQASLVWEDTQDAAEQYYDRTSACTFTTFIGYEWSGQPGGNNLHRNVIFRNQVAPPLPISYMEEPTPQGLWQQLRAQCLEGLPGCDVLAIPHNPNASGGLMFAPVNADGSPLAASDAFFRASMEPLVEMNQHKGDSECRPGVGGATDELCGFEKLNRLQLFSPVSDPNQVFPARNYIRNVLKDGLLQEQAIGVNPFKLGMIGSTDDHNSTPGAVEEADYGGYGHIGNRDRNPANMLARVTPAGIESTPGGLAVVWAEENSRDALFAAMRRREVYGTSGTRPILRFFAGREPGLHCGDPEFVATAYRGGVPMGGEIGPVRGTRSPRFGVLAMRDPGTPSAPGGLLQRLQIVKGWIDDSGQSREKVFEVAGDPASTATVDTATCQTSGPGAESLCAVWEDPEFDPSQRAFYYARLLENPSCRWSTYLCNSLHLDCSVPASVPAEYAECCNPAVAKTIQERAWSSPIWYRPEGLTRLRGKLSFGRDPQRDMLQLQVTFGALPPGFDVRTQELVIALQDDDEVFRVAVPAGFLQEETPGHFIWRDRAGNLSGVRSLDLTVKPGGPAVLRLRTLPRAFPNADRTDHFMELTVRAGTAEVRAAPLWSATSHRLATRG